MGNELHPSSSVTLAFREHENLARSKIEEEKPSMQTSPFKKLNLENY